MKTITIEKVRRDGNVISGKFAAGKIKFVNGETTPMTDKAVRDFAAMHPGAAKITVALLLSGSYSDAEIATIIKVAAIKKGEVLSPSEEDALDKKCIGRVRSIQAGCKSKNAPSESYKKLTWMTDKAGKHSLKSSIPIKVLEF